MQGAFKKCVRYQTITLKDKCDWKIHAITDFEHFLEREGCLNYERGGDKLDILFVDSNLIDHLGAMDNELFTMVSNATCVIIHHALLCATGPFDCVLEEFWPKRTYFLIHQNTKLLDYSPNVIPIFYDFVYHEYRSLWFRVPYKSLNYYATGVYNDRHFSPAEVSLNKRLKIALCTTRTRPFQPSRTALENLFKENTHWQAFSAFKSYLNKDQLVDKTQYIPGMKDDPVANLQYSPLEGKLYKNKTPVNKYEDLLGNSNLIHNQWAQANLVHNEFYQNSYISIYSESLETYAVYVTEKTYAPLINGHFILPFATNGFVDHLKCRGFKFPDFIDYSYDSISDHEKRFEAYANELKRLMSFSLEQWHDFYIRNIDIIHYNRQKIWSDPFPKLGIL